MQPVLPPVLADACVLIVDDQPANVALLTRLLQSGGVTKIHSVTDSRQAVRRCLEVDADLVLLDMHMPFLDGLAVLSQLQDALPDDAFVPVLVLTADSTAPMRDRALNAGANDFLTKPFERTEVLLRIRNLLETRALYRTVQRHNVELQADIQARAMRERRQEEAQRLRHARIERALGDGAISMVFQPIADLYGGSVRGAEALARFSCEPRRPPNQWFDEAAVAGLGSDLELAAVRVAVSHMEDVPDDAFLSVNVSATTVLEPGLERALESVPADRLVLELTEHAQIEDYPQVLDLLTPLRRRGVRIAVDDTGAGYAGLRHLVALHPDIIKLDIDLTRSIDADPARRALATAMVSFSEEVGAVIIAEGVETDGELHALRDLGIPMAQGFHLARPGHPPLPAHLDALAGLGT